MEIKGNPLVTNIDQYFEENGMFYMVFEVAKNGTLETLLFQW
jgi:hypothetical protein